MIGRLTFHHLVSLGCKREDTENIKTKVNPCPQFSLSLSLSHTHTHTHTSLFTSCKYFTTIILLATKKNEAHLSRSSHLLCRHRHSSHASYH
ncbi:hypothetical protein E4U40_006364 [Claviceps sp. LM458 group G5]|nr:hypothetical protein E4U40_006364 [Claviceps sp. LM458 group G5]